MVSTVIITLIWICVIVGVVFLAKWVLEQIGVAIPAQVMKIVWVVVVLICLLILWQAFGGMIPGSPG